jgi:hypothetical protein
VCRPDDVAEQRREDVRGVVGRFHVDPAARPVQVGGGFDQHLTAAGEAEHDDGVAEPYVLQFPADQQADRPRLPGPQFGVHVGCHDWHSGYLDRLVGLFDGRTVARTFIREP